MNASEVKSLERLLPSVSKKKKYPNDSVLFQNDKE